MGNDESVSANGISANHAKRIDAREILCYDIREDTGAVKQLRPLTLYDTISRSHDSERVFAFGGLAE